MDEDIVALDRLYKFSSVMQLIGYSRALHCLPLESNFWRLVNKVEVASEF